MCVWLPVVSAGIGLEVGVCVHTRCGRGTGENRKVKKEVEREPAEHWLKKKRRGVGGWVGIVGVCTQKGGEEGEGGRVKGKKKRRNQI